MLACAKDGPAHKSPWSPHLPSPASRTIVDSYPLMNVGPRSRPHLQPQRTVHNVRTQSLPSECDFRWLRLKRWFEPARDTPARPNRGETIFRQCFIAPCFIKLSSMKIVITVEFSWEFQARLPDFRLAAGKNKLGSASVGNLWGEACSDNIRHPLQPTSGQHRVSVETYTSRDDAAAKATRQIAHSHRVVCTRCKQSATTAE